MFRTGLLLAAAGQHSAWL